jgi:hypothetical protein
MEGLMRKFMKTAGLAVAFAAMAVSSASAASGPAMLKTTGTIGTASNTGAISGNAASYGTHVFTAGAAKVNCEDATFHIRTITTTAATIVPTYSGCALNISGTNVAPATVTTGCDWDLNFGAGTFHTSGLGTGGTVTTTCTTVVDVPAIGCQLDVFGQTRPGITSQNIDAAGANSASATPWGSKIIASVTGLTYTTTTAPGGNCVIAEHGTGTYAGTVAVHNVWGSL